MWSYYEELRHGDADSGSGQSAFDLVQATSHRTRDQKKDSQVLPPFVQLVEWLVQEKHMVVWVESAVLEDKLLRDDVKLEQESSKFQKVHQQYAGVRARFLDLREKLVTFK